MYPPIPITSNFIKYEPRFTSVVWSVTYSSGLRRSRFKFQLSGIKKRGKWSARGTFSIPEGEFLPDSKEPGHQAGLAICSLHLTDLYSASACAFISLLHVHTREGLGAVDKHKGFQSGSRFQHVTFIFLSLFPRHRHRKERLVWVQHGSKEAKITELRIERRSSVILGVYWRNHALKRWLYICSPALNNPAWPLTSRDEALSIPKGEIPNHRLLSYLETVNAKAQPLAPYVFPTLEHIRAYPNWLFTRNYSCRKQQRAVCDLDGINGLHSGCQEVLKEIICKV